MLGCNTAVVILSYRFSDHCNSTYYKSSTAVVAVVAVVATIRAVVATSGHGHVLGTSSAMTSMTAGAFLSPAYRSWMSHGSNDKPESEEKQSLVLRRRS